ncbi:MAG: hypothetical protein AAGD04_07675 [Pseudomonadota bacterium]
MFSKNKDLRPTAGVGLKAPAQVGGRVLVGFASWQWLVSKAIQVFGKVLKSTSKALKKEKPRAVGPGFPLKVWSRD